MREPAVDPSKCRWCEWPPGGAAGAGREAESRVPGMRDEPGSRASSDAVCVQVPGCGASRNEHQSEVDAVEMMKRFLRMQIES